VIVVRVFPQRRKEKSLGKDTGVESNTQEFLEILLAVPEIILILLGIPLDPKFFAVLDP
jgi:hypothetical protein